MGVDVSTKSFSTNDAKNEEVIVTESTSKADTNCEAIKELCGDVLNEIVKSGVNGIRDVKKQESKLHVNSEYHKDRDDNKENWDFKQGSEKFQETIVEEEKIKESSRIPVKTAGGGKGKNKKKKTT